jgi:hypothetical protein
MKIIQWLKGKKTYIIQALALVYAASGYFTGNLDGKTALDILYSTTSISALRSALSQPKV